MKNRLLAFVLIFGSVFYSCNGNNDEGQDVENNDATIPAPITMSFQVVNQFSHDTSAFTEGFTFHRGKLYESTGSPEAPSNSGTWIGSIDLKTGRYDKKVNMGNTYFGEGITFLGDQVFQLTYKSQVGFVYDANSFKKLKEFKFKSEGWGLTNDGNSLIMSAGTSNIYYLSANSLSFVKMLPVQDNNGYVDNINELEYIDGFIYANKWLTPYILKIDPTTGYVVGRFDLSKQVSEIKSKYEDAEELNGIAYDSTTRKTYITGKKWPVIYEIKW